MNQATRWWLHHTPQGRRLLDRVVPASAIPASTRRQMCAEGGHSRLGDGSCRRCGAGPACAECGAELTPGEARALRRREPVEHRGRGRREHAVRMER